MFSKGRQNKILKRKCDSALETFLQTMEGQLVLGEAEKARLSSMFEAGYMAASIDALLNENVLLEADLSLRSSPLTTKI